MAWRGRIVRDPNICSGKPVIHGTRIMGRNILGMAAGGYTLEQIVQAYPELTPEDVRAALEYAAIWGCSSAGAPTLP